MTRFFFQSQYDTIDCGPACLKMLARHYGRDYPLEYLREKCHINREGVSLPSITEAAEGLGFRTLMAKISSEQLLEHCPLPCILHWNQNHFIVLYAIRKPSGLISKRRNNGHRFIIADPAHGIVKLDMDTFLRSWKGVDHEQGVVLLLEPKKDFYEVNPKIEPPKNGYRFILKYLTPYRKYLLQLAIGMIAMTFISLAFPLLTQVLIDEGVGKKNLSVIYLVFASQFFLFLGSIGVDLIRSWLLLHINTRISLTIISDFLIKLLSLPIRFFDTKAVGDLSQRINDHHRIETFLTGSFLSSIFSVINILIFMAVLAHYEFSILVVFLVISGFAILWVQLFQRRRMTLDYKRFSRNRENQDKLFEMISGMQEIKLFGAETTTRWNWEQLQVRYFKLNIESLTLEQVQHTGYLFLMQLKNIVISFLAVYEVVNGNLSLGALLSISYIIGQTNGPIDQLISVMKNAQDAKLSMDRLQEIHDKDEEEDGFAPEEEDSRRQGDIVLDKVSFQYDGPHSPFVLKDISMTIRKGKITAIVGSSGSGKTTLMKILLNFYSPSTGEVHIGGRRLCEISPKGWRNRCGTVLQDGYVFHDTIANNIALGAVEIDSNKLRNAVKAANLEEFVDSLPMTYSTKIGSSGMGISGGQKQRILIARAVYKDPEYLFFDEATSSLDANNETIIIDNLNKFFAGKTVVVIAHRLSTVKNADQIIMLENGRIIERGDHSMLCNARGKYFQLVKNQLQLS